MNTPRRFSSVRISRIRKPLDAHAGDADDVGAGAALEVDGLDVLVDQRDCVLRRSQGGQQRQAGDRQVGALAEERQDACSMPQNETSNRGLMMTMSAMNGRALGAGCL